MAYEQRQHRRLDDDEITAYVSLSKKTEDLPAGKEWTGKFLDIAEGGAKLLVDTALPIDAEIHLDFILSRTVSGDIMVAADGQVVRCLPAVDDDGFEVGVSFLFVSDGDRDRISAYIQYRLPGGI